MKGIIAIFYIIIASISCGTSKSISNPNIVNSATDIKELSKFILDEFKDNNYGLLISKLQNKGLRKKLENYNFDILSISYKNDNTNSNKGFYGNLDAIPDSCILLDWTDYKTGVNDLVSERLFYFFGKTKPIYFSFRTYKPISEEIKKYNDSIWIQKSVHKLITTN